MQFYVQWGLGVIYPTAEKEKCSKMSSGGLVLYTLPSDWDAYRDSAVCGTHSPPLLPTAETNRTVVKKDINTPA